jgi:sulfate adenylyltransferase
MGAADYARVVEEMRLANGQLFPIPVTLPVSADDKVELDQDVALLDWRNDILAVMTVEEIYEWELETAARQVFGTTDARHPLVAEMHGWGSRNISGRLRFSRAASDACANTRATCADWNQERRCVSDA